MRTCCNCKVSKDESEFFIFNGGKNSNLKKSRLEYRCKTCKNEWGRENYARTKEYFIKRRTELKQKCVDYLGGSCKLCGYKKYIGALAFHHLNDELKEFSISTKTRDMRNKVSMVTFEDLKGELDKCILLCFNCHLEIHKGVSKLTI